MTSAPSAKGAHSSAQRIIKAAPMEKFGATTAWADPENQPRDGLDVARVEAGRAAHGVQAVLRAPTQVLPRRLGDSEVHDHLGPGLGHGLDAAPDLERAGARTGDVS